MKNLGGRMGKKTCFKCGKTKSTKQFYKHSDMAGKRLGKCKMCTRQDVLSNYNKNRMDPKWMDKERERCRKKQMRAYIPIGPNRPSTVSVGYTCELLAAADLNHRCGKVGGWAYLNPAHQTPDDAFAKTSRGWRTVQVKKGQRYKRKNGVEALVLLKRKKTITSDIIAVVDLEGLRIRYLPNVGRLPKELPQELSPICSGLIFFEDPTNLLEEK
jgi:hypothetical protein